MDSLILQSTCNLKILILTIFGQGRAFDNMSGPRSQARVARGRGSRVADFAQSSGSRVAGRGSATPRDPANPGLDHPFRPSGRIVHVPSGRTRCRMAT